MKFESKNGAFVAAAVAVALLLLVVVRGSPDPSATYSEFLRQVQAGQVSKATIMAQAKGPSPVRYTLKDGRRDETVAPSDYRNLLDLMTQKMVDIEIRDASAQWARVLVNASPFLLLLGFWFFTLGRLRGRAAR